MLRAYVRDIAVHLPPEVLTNDDLAESLPGWDADRFGEKTGIARRHVAQAGQCASDLACLAAEELWVLVSDDGCGYRASSQVPGLGWGLTLIAKLSEEYVITERGTGGTEVRMRFPISPTGDTVDRSRSDVDWRKTTYHTPQDDMSQAFDFDAAATHVRLNFLIGLLVCQDDHRPTWNKGDFFGGRFGPR